MSVINQALRDLDERGASPRRPVPEQIQASLAPSSDNGNLVVSRKTLAVVAIVLLSMLFVAGLYSVFGASTKTDLATEQLGIKSDMQSGIEVGAMNTPIMKEGDGLAEDASNDVVALESVSATQQPQTIDADQKVVVVRESGRVSVTRTETGAQDGSLQGSISQSSMLEADRDSESLGQSANTEVSAVKETSDQNSQSATAVVEEVGPLNKQNGVDASSSSALPVSASPKSLDFQAALAARRKAEVGDLNGARADLESFINQQSVHEASRLELARILVKQGDRAALDSLLKIDSGVAMSEQPEMRMIAARRYLELQKLDEAHQALRLALPPIESQPHYYALLASIEQKRGRYLQQIDIYQRLIDAHGDRAKWWLGSAIGWDQLENYESAQRAYMRAKQLNLSDPALMAFVDQRLKQLRGHQ